MEADLNDDLTVTVGASRVLLDSPYQGYGLPRYSTGESLSLSRKTFLSGKDDHLEKDTNSVFLEAVQQLGSDWSLNFSSVYNEFDQYFSNYYFAGMVDPSNGSGVTGRLGHFDETYRDMSMDLHAKGTWTLFGMNNDAIFGYDYQRLTSDSSIDYFAINNIPNIFTFNPSDYPDQSTVVRTGFNKEKTAQSGVYGNIRLGITDDLHVIAGGRLSRYYTNYTSQSTNLVTGVVGDPSSTPYSDKNVFTPYGGIVYDLNKNIAAYASVADIYKSQASYRKGPAPGSPLDPVTGTNYEAGLKGDFYDGKLNAMAALYYVKREDAAVQDSQYPYSDGPSGSSCCYIAGGEAISKGLDLEVSGEILPRLQGTIGYTLNFNENKTTGASYNALTPKHLFKMYAGYQLPGALSALRLGGGVTAQSSSYVSGQAYQRDASGAVTGDAIDYKFVQPGYSVWSGFAEYALTDNWTVTGNLNNIFDKKYYSTVGDLTYGNFYGAPRNYTMTLRGSF